MTQTYAAEKLLEHGPLTFYELWGITGWEMEDVKAAVNTLVASGKVAAVNKAHHMYYTLVKK